jgi:hypothetical protein
MRRLPAGALLLALSLLWTGCSLASLKKPPYCPAEPVARRAEPEGEGGPLWQKARGYEEWAEKLWAAPYGGVVVTQFQDATYEQVVGYEDLQDSTIWTGTYLAAEAFRHAVTGDPKAKENAARAIRTLDFFLKVTGQPGYIARFAGPPTPTYLSYVGGSCAAKGKHPCYPGNAPDGQPAFWIGGTTRDQYTGWFFGMGVAYRLIDDPELRTLIRADVKEVIDALRASDYKIWGPEGRPKSSGQDALPSMQLSWLLVAADVLRDDPAGYCKVYEERVKKVLPLALVDNYSGLNKYMQYYGFNLDFLNNYNLILLEPNAERKKAYLDAFRDGAYRFVRGTGNSFWDFVDMAASGMSDPQTLASDHQSLSLFQPAPNVVRCIQPPPPAHLNRTSLVLSGIEGFLSHFGLKQNIYPQAETAYPLDDWCPDDFIWQQSPYLTCCFDNCASGGSGNPACRNNTFQSNVINPGADYLVAYWMGRYHGFLKPGD